MRALEGVRVVEMSVGLMAPSAGVYLADMGADVIKVEPPEGDLSRLTRGPGNTLPQSVPGTMFVAANRGKRSVCLDARSEQGRDAVLRMLRTADVFLTNVRADALERYGLDPDVLSREMPSLICAVGSGYGPSGPDALAAMVDGAGQARGGIVSVTGTLAGCMLADMSAAMQLALGVVTALYVREKHCIAQRVDVSAYGAQLFMQQWELAHASLTGHRWTTSTGHHPLIAAMYGLYRTSDGRDVFIAGVQQEDAWAAFCAFGGDPDLAGDERWNSMLKRAGLGGPDAIANAAELRPRVAALVATRTLDEWMGFLGTQPEIIAGRVWTYAEILGDPQAHANGYVVEVEVPDAGHVPLVGQPVALARTPASVDGVPPAQGAHTAEVLTEIGFGPDEIASVEAATAEARTAFFAAMSR